ncbi:MAG: hypothetical protein EOP04_23375, partial [Proteobacteria bacterium]
LMEETPKHSVLAKFDDKEVLVTEGDLRGLLTKAWADNAPDNDQYFLGRRCNENTAEAHGEIPHGEKGRGYYGEIVRGEAKQGFYVSADLYVPWTTPNQRVYQVTYSDDDTVQGYMLETYRNRRSYFVLAKDVANIEKYVQSGDVSLVEVLPSVKMFGCWDVNPASYHIALMEKIGKVGTGLVMDRTRTGQVWNQPIYGADFEIGELKNVFDAPHSNKRAPGTAYVATVTARVKWIGEPAEPSMAYSKDYDVRHTQESVYTYVLEFGRNKVLLGGEWGTLDATDPKQVTPDFIYGFSKGSKPKDNLETGFDYEGIINELHKCSLTNDVDGEYDVNGKRLKYKTCAITKPTAPTN